MSCEKTVQWTGSTKTAGKEDHVELDFRDVLQLFASYVEYVGDYLTWNTTLVFEIKFTEKFEETK